MLEIFNPQNYYWNPYALPMFAGAIFLFSIGFFVWINKKDLFGFIYCLWTGSAAIGWLFITGFMLIAKTNELALFLYNKIGFLGIAFISVHGYFLSLLWHKEHSKQQKKILIAGYLIMAFFAVSNFLYNTVCTGTYEYFWGKQPKYSWSFGIIYLCLWFAFFLITAVNYYREYKIRAGLKKRQSRIILVGLIIVYFGAVDYIPTFGFEVYSFGYIPVVLFFSIMFYVIIRYRAFEIDTVIHKTALWLLTSSLILIPIGTLLYFTRPWLAQLNWIQLTFVTTGLFYFYLYYYHKMQPRIDHLFRRRKYDYYQILREIGSKMGTELDINNVIACLFKELKDVLYIRSGLILVQQLGQQDYAGAGSIGYDKLQDTSKDRQGGVLYTSNLSQWLNVHQKALEREQIEIDPQYGPIKQEALTWLNQNMLELLIPIVMENRVNGLIGIGKKENLQAYTAKDIELLEKMGRQLGVTIDNALHHEDIVEKERLDEEMKLGREIQINLLPRQIPEVPYLSLQGYMNPAKEIGGDYYDFITLPNKEELAIVIGDASGKGVAAGLLMSMVKATIYSCSQEGISPKQILLRTNAFLYQHVGGQKFMTLLYLKWHSQSRTLHYSSAGHEHILICRSQSQQVEAIQSGGFMLGMVPDIENFLEEKQIRLESRDKILLYTDGVTEAENASGERFGLEQLKESFQRHSQKPPNELMQAVKDETYAFIGNHPQYDDITLVVMEAL